VSQLNMLDLLHTDGLPDAQEIARRGKKQRRRNFLARFLNPLAIRVPLFDPNGFLDETWPLVRPVFSVVGGIAYIILIIAALITAGQHWDGLTGNLVDRVLSTGNLLVLVLVYPLVKAIHEIGHGYAVKKFGGEVREIGVMFLVFLPVPYVDASAASGYTNKWARMLVGGAGILVELGLAAIAVLLWAQMEEGLVRAMLFNVILIGGVSTLLFNGNPLLRFDGYYVFSDLLEIPNLGARSNRYLGYLIQRRLFGVKEARNPVRARGEAPWFFFYSIAAFIYRLFISFVIVSIVAVQFFVVGVLLAIWALTLMFLLPLAKQIRFLFTSDTLRGLRGRAVTVSFGLLAVVLALFTLVPVPYRTIAEGVVVTPEGGALYAEEAGEIAEVLVTHGSTIAPGDTVLQLVDPFAQAELDRAVAEARRARLRYQQAFSTSAFDTRLWRAQTVRADQEVELLQQRMANMAIRSSASGRVVLPEQVDLPGRYIGKGEIVGYVVDPRRLLVKAVIPQEEADLIRRRTSNVVLRPAENLATEQQANIVRMVPAIGGLLPSMALTTEGGGPFALDPEARGAPRSIEPVMQLEIETDEPLIVQSLGSRVYVRFDHGSEPLATRLARAARQLFLRQFGV